MPFRVKFKIADTTFQFSSPNPKPILWFKRHYRTYICGDDPDLDISLTFGRRRMGGGSPGNPELISEDGRFFLSTDFFDVKGNYPGGKIDVLANHDMGPADLTRTLFAIIAVKRGGFLLHASAVADGDRSYVFCGPSESGKTTIARLLQEKDVLTDETTAVVNTGGRYYAYATPFFGELGKITKNTGAPIRAVFFIHKGKDFSHKRIGKAAAMRYFLNDIILRGRNPDLTKKLLDNLYDLAGSVSCYDLYFKPERELWRYVNGIN